MQEPIYFKLSEFDFPYETMPNKIKVYGIDYLIPSINPFRIKCGFPFIISYMGGYRPKWWNEQQGRYYFTEHESLWACDISIGSAGQYIIAVQYLPLYTERYGVSNIGYWFHFGIGYKILPEVFKTRNWIYD